LADVATVFEGANASGGWALHGPFYDAVDGLQRGCVGVSPAASQVSSEQKAQLHARGYIE